MQVFNPLNAELNPIRHLLALVGAHHIVHVSRIRVNVKPYLDEKLVAETSPVAFLLVSSRRVVISFCVTHVIHLHSYGFRLFILHMVHWPCEFTNEEFTNKIIYMKKTTDNYSFPFTLSKPAI